MSILPKIETEITIAGAKAYPFIVYEPFEDRILGLHLTWQPNSIAMEMFLKELKKMHGMRPMCGPTT